MTIEEFKEAVSKHDFSYEYSDDHRWWKSGIASEEKIKKLAIGLDPKLILEIWNHYVEEKYEGNEFKINLETAKEWSGGKNE